MLVRSKNWMGPDDVLEPLQALVYQSVCYNNSSPPDIELLTEKFVQLVELLAVNGSLGSEDVRKLIGMGKDMFCSLKREPGE
jgi:hypothetical protein